MLTPTLHDHYCSTQLRGWVTLRLVIWRSANHFKSLYDLLVLMEERFRQPDLPSGPSFASLLTAAPSLAEALTATEPPPPLTTRALETLSLVEESATELSLERTMDRVRHFKEYLNSQGINLRLGDPRIEAELRALKEALDDDLNKRVVFYPSPEKLKFTGGMGKQFDFGTLRAQLPDAHDQLTQAQYCYVADNESACVYHAMGAAEYGLRALAKRLRLRKHLLATWGLLLKELRKKIEKMQGQTKTRKRREELDFYSSLLDQCVFFNEHYRKPTAHLPPKYETADALNALTRSAEFLKTLAGRKIGLPRQLPHI